MSNNPCLLLLFCSDSCRARFLAERNTKPVNVAKAPPAVAQSSSPPLSSENVQIHSGILNPQCYQTSPASMEQALWLSRATALLRVEEERRKHEHLKQTLLKYAPQVHSVWKSNKKSHSTLRAKRVTEKFEWPKVYWKCQKWSILATFWKPEACGQTVLPDR